MRIKLIKRGQETNKKEQPVEAKQTDLVTTMQSWVEEFKARKNKLDLAAVGLARQE
ncbi:MAG TPA: hypothetical protein VNO14_00215 [Blastocatellia bacterium]|nr:hypothetical protein [Blastocatellia bacterium]